MTIKRTTVLMAAVLAVATVLAAGLTILPSSVHEAQANPCSMGQFGEGSSLTASSNANEEESEAETEIFDCDFEGVVIDEEVNNEGGTIQ
jgi:hypothetical protein